MPLPAQKLPVKRTQPANTNTKSTISDPRFASLQTDPRYRLPSRKHTHVKLDKRFASILKNDEFSRKASVDRYGRKIEKGAGRKELERLYELESGDEDEVVEKELKRVGDAEGKEKKYDPAREGGFSESSSSEEESDDEDDVEEAELYPQSRDTEVPMGEASRRIAVVNMDWDNIRAADIMAVAGSFVPEGGRIEQVVVYPSEFGRERMQREELEGPPREIFANENSRGGAVDKDEESDEEEERIRKELLQEDKGEEFNSTALRRYQIDRLRYYYAVITCSSTSVAQALYDALDGREYLSSANFFDLRFIPDDVEFDESPRDSCEDVVDGYKPTEFVTDALNHSRVKLTWDADDGKRRQVQKRAFSRKEIDENDLQAYIGSASSSDEDEEEEELEALESGGVDVDVMSTMSKRSRADRRDALRAALGLPAEPEKRTKRKDREAPVGNMQISFTPGISASDEKRPVFENEPIVEETTREKYIRKERERKAKRKERAKARREGRDPDDAPQHVDQAPAENEAIADAAADGFDDPFFNDPASSSAAAVTKARKEGKAKRIKERAAEEEANKAKRAELELLMDDEKNVRHFDMKDIVKAEKQKKKRKKNKGGRAEDGVEEVHKRDGFQMDVKDPRFSRLFESHEFAIDPTNPRFKGTEGMKALLEEGRQKRKVEDVGTGNSDRVKKAKAAESGQDVSQLVAKLKRKSK